MEQFSDRIRSLRMLKKRSQTDVAEAIGISQSTYSAIENGREPEFEVLSKMAEYFDVTLDYLIDGRTNVSIKNYGDFVEVLQGIIDTEISISLQRLVMKKEDIDYFADGFTLNKGFYGLMRFDDENVVELFEGWSQTLKLYKEGTIDRELYTLWLQKRINEYRSIPIPTLDGDEKNA